MKIDFVTPLKTLDGKSMWEEVDDVKEVDGEKQIVKVKRDVNLRIIAINALMGSYPDEAEKLSGEEKLSRYVLAQKIHGGNNDLKPEEASLVKKLIAKAYATSIVGPAYALIDGAK